MSTPTYDFLLCEEASLLENIQQLYETENVNKAIVVCISENDCDVNAKILEDKNYTTVTISKNHPRRSLAEFLHEPNHILLTTASFLESMSDDDWVTYIMNSNHNSIFSYGTPSYMVDPIMNRIMEYHKKGFWVDYQSKYHIRWILD